MEKLIKNIEHRKTLTIAGEADYLPCQIVSKTLAKNNGHSLTLFAFDRGEEISAHESAGDAMVVALDGVGRVIIDGRDYSLKAGETIVMPAGLPHAVQAVERFKMLLIVSFPEKQEKEK